MWALENKIKNKWVLNTIWPLLDGSIIHALKKEKKERNELKKFLKVWNFIIFQMCFTLLEISVGLNKFKLLMDKLIKINIYIKKTKKEKSN